MIVETGPVRVASAHASQNMRQHLLAACFANRSGNADKAATFLLMGNASHDRQIAKCLQTVTHQNLCATFRGERRVINEARDQCGPRPIFGRSNNEVMAISLCAGEGDKQAAIVASAAVDGDIGDDEISALPGGNMAASPGQNFGCVKRR